MIVFVCLDDNNGMMFNKRRQSRDRNVLMDMVREAGGAVLQMNTYSAKPFRDIDGTAVKADEEFMEKVEAGQFCFAENIPLSEYENKMEKIVLYRWNRSYPYDLQFDIPLEAHGWRCTEATEFPGSSHERITKEVYIK